MAKRITETDRIYFVYLAWNDLRQVKDARLQATLAMWGWLNRDSPHPELVETILASPIWFPTAYKRMDPYSLSDRYGDDSFWWSAHLTEARSYCSGILIRANGLTLPSDKAMMRRMVTLFLKRDQRVNGGIRYRPQWFGQSA